jgi:polar amino acid transport system substrate-binding protein
MEPIVTSLQRLMFVVITTASVALFGSGCGKEETTSTTGAPAPAKTLVVGTEATFPPFEMRDEKGEIVGFDIELVKAISAKNGHPVEIKDMGFDALIPALQAGQIDLIASGLSITDERKKVIDYSDPYIEAGLVLAVRKDEKAIRGSTDLAGKSVAVQQGSTGAKTAEAMLADKKIGSIKQFPNVPLAMMELAKGGVDVVINDKPVSEAIVAQQKDILLLPEVLESDSYGFAMRKGNTELQTKVNASLKELQAEGFIDTLKAKYFKATAE